MANTIHTMSILFKQMWDGGESTVGPELLSGVQGSWVVAGTCLFRKFPLSAVSELFPSIELLLDSSPLNSVTFPNWCPRGTLLSVPLAWTT